MLGPPADRLGYPAESVCPPGDPADSCYFERCRADPESRTRCPRSPPGCRWSGLRFPGLCGTRLRRVTASRSLVAGRGLARVFPGTGARVPRLRRVTASRISRVASRLTRSLLPGLDLVTGVVGALASLRLRGCRGGVARWAGGVLHCVPLRVALAASVAALVLRAALGLLRAVARVGSLGVGRVVGLRRRRVALAGVGVQQALLLEALGQLAELGINGRWLLAAGGVVLAGLTGRIGACRSLVGTRGLVLRSTVLSLLAVVARSALVGVILALLPLILFGPGLILARLLVGEGTWSCCGSVSGGGLLELLAVLGWFFFSSFCLSAGATASVISMICGAV